MTMLTAIVVFTCTWLFANADPKPCPQAIDCMTADRNCPSNATFTCLSNLRGTCDVDESKVTFSELLPYSQRMCNEIFPCETLGACNEDIKLTQIMGASPEEQRAMSGLLVSSDTFCRVCSWSRGEHSSYSDWCCHRKFCKINPKNLESFMIFDI
ncbi:uncharacterized protein LOC112559909 isoform X2 [Pomacea canaliculata]|uniref:uncharacterized protein LOC112559909 isoform X2 n=1 Tax=Pomacea canaliculata TaxID=400727 RepID=UPI000D72CD62|nr:uncharacterized protein LOC112559909 isoform X2 [Pomacea canaliculata]